MREDGKLVLMIKLSERVHILPDPVFCCSFEFVKVAMFLIINGRRLNCPDARHLKPSAARSSFKFMPNLNIICLPSFVVVRRGEHIIQILWRFCLQYFIDQEN